MRLPHRPVAGCVWLALTVFVGAVTALAGPPGLDDREAQAHLEDMERRGVLRDPAWSHAYLVRAASAPSDDARISDLRWAVEFDPEAIGARLRLARSLALRGEGEFASQLLQAGLEALRSFPAQQGLARGVIALIFVGLGATLSILALLAILRATPRLGHGLREKLFFLPAEARTGCVWLTILFPVGIAVALPPTAALFWILALGGAASWRVLETWERRTLVLAFAAILLAPVALSVWIRLDEPSLPGSYLRTFWASQRAPATVHETQLAPPPGGGLEDPEYFATLALLDRRAKRYDASAAWLERAIALDPLNWAYHNNLANLKLLGGDVNGALQAYDRAAGLAPKEALIHVNQAQAWVAKLEFTKADESLQRAVALGHRLASAQSDDPNEYVVHDRTLGALDLWSRFGRGMLHETGLSWKRTLTMTLAPLFPLSPFWMSLPLFAALFYTAAARHLPKVYRCAGCATFVCRKCHFRLHRKSFCSACYAIRQEVRAPLKRDQLLAERRAGVARPGRIAGLALSLALPGAGHWLRGIGASAIQVGASCTLLAIVAGGLLLPDSSPSLAPSPWIARIAVPALLFVALAVQAVRGYLRAASRPLEEPEPQGPRSS